MPGAYFCGTSGWQYPQFKKTFYPEDLASAAQLQFFAERFNTVEINSTFYRLSRASTFAKWSTQTPEKFCFAVKAHRYFTHENHLGDPDNQMPAFIESLKDFGPKLGPILFQLPASFHFDPERLEAFVDLLPEDHRFVFEFRHDSWQADATYEILEARNIANCAYDLRGYQNEVRLTADFGYVRLHGPGPLPYRGSYSDEALGKWAERFKKWSAKNYDTFVYFDNSMTGDAPVNAARLVDYLKGDGRAN